MWERANSLASAHTGQILASNKFLLLRGKEVTWIYFFKVLYSLQQVAEATLLIQA